MAQTHADTNTDKPSHTLTKTKTTITVKPAENCITTVLKQLFTLIITLVLCAFPWWACSSLQAGRTQQNSCEDAMLFDLLPAFWSSDRAASRHCYTVCGLKTHLHLHLCQMWSQCVPIHLQKWFDRSDHNPSFKSFSTWAFKWSSADQLRSDQRKHISMSADKGGHCLLDCNAKTLACLHAPVAAA